MQAEASVQNTRKRRLAPQDRREFILRSAADCFARRGTFQVPMTELAEVLGISRNLLYHYFHSQEVLLNAVLDRVSEKLAKRLEAVPHEASEEAVRAILAVYIDFLSDHASALKEIFASPAEFEKLRGHIRKDVLNLSRRLAEAFGLPWSGAVRASLTGAAYFMVAFAQDEIEHLPRGRKEAEELFLGILKAALAGTEKFELAAKPSGAEKNKSAVRLREERGVRHADLGD